MERTSASPIEGFSSLIVCAHDDAATQYVFRLERGEFGYLLFNHQRELPRPADCLEHLGSLLS